MSVLRRSGGAWFDEFRYSRRQDEQTYIWCEACRLDLVEFSSRPENAMPEDFDVADETKLDQVWQQLAERKRRQDEFMLERLRKRATMIQGEKSPQPCEA